MSMATQEKMALMWFHITEATRIARLIIITARKAIQTLTQEKEAQNPLMTINQKAC